MDRIDATFDDVTIDEAIAQFQNVCDKIVEYDTKSGLDKMLSKAMINAETPDERFKAEQLMSIRGNILDQLRILRYINTPIRQEGTLQSRGKDSVQLKNIFISSGAQIEYMSDGAWKFAILKYDETEQRFILVNAWNRKTEVENIDGIYARVRE